MSYTKMGKTIGLSVANKTGVEQTEEAAKQAFDEIKEEIAGGLTHKLTVTANEKVDMIHDQIGNIDFKSFMAKMSESNDEQTNDDQNRLSM